MTRRRTWLMLGIGVVLLAGGLRFARLGAWPFWRDEMETVLDVRSFTGVADFPPSSQTYRLPRLLPVSYSLLALGQRLFGDDELGSRVVPALVGTLHVGLVFFLLRSALGRRAALATALLMALWPQHVHLSQENRFYTIGATLATLAMIAGARAVRRRSPGWAIGACAIAALAVLAHTLLAILLVGIFVAFLASAWAGQDRRLARLAWIAPVAGLVVLAVFVAYVLPLARGWNAGETFGQSAAQSVLSALALLGWPVALLSGVGACLALRRPTATDAYWLAWLGFFGAAVIGLPLVVQHHGEYTFLFTFAALVPAGRAVAHFAGLLRPRGRVAMAAWLAAACLLELPGLVSHYIDGSRLDFRAPAQYVAAHWRPGDRVSSFSPRVFARYAPGVSDVVSLPRSPDGFARVGAGARRVWVVVYGPPGDKEPGLEAWLAANCRSCFVHRPRRPDHQENITEVYLYYPEKAVPGGAPAGALAGVALPGEGG